MADTVLHTALSHPEISFRFLRDGKQQYVTPGDGDLRSAVYAVLGREFARDLLAVDGGSPNCTMSPVWSRRRVPAAPAAGHSISL